MSVVIEFKGVSKQLGHQKVVEDINFTILQNDIFGYLGPNGAGKTTTIRLLLGLLEPTAGEVLIKGKNPTKNEIRKIIGFCLDDDGLYGGLTARDNLEFFDRIYNTTHGRQKRINDILEKVELHDVYNKKVFEFSKGMKRRLALGRALIVNPQILVLDEPMSGLDPDGQLLFRNIIKNLAKEATIFFSSHNLNDVENICNRVAIINKKILVSNTMENLRKLKGDKLIRFTVNEEQNIKGIIPEIENLPGIKKVNQNNNVIDVYYESLTDSKNLIQFFINKGINICEMSEPKANLEDIYFSLIRGEKIG